MFLPRLLSVLRFDSSLGKWRSGTSDKSQVCRSLILYVPHTIGHQSTCISLHSVLSLGLKSGDAPYLDLRGADSHLMLNHRNSAHTIVAYQEPSYVDLGGLTTSFSVVILSPFNILFDLAMGNLAITKTKLLGGGVLWGNRRNLMYEEPTQSETSLQEGTLSIGTKIGQESRATINKA